MTNNELLYVIIYDSEVPNLILIAYIYYYYMYVCFLIGEQFIHVPIVIQCTRKHRLIMFLGFKKIEIRYDK